LGEVLNLGLDYNLTKEMERSVGDQVGNAVSGTLYYAPKEEFERVLGSALPKLQKVKIFADLCRLNTLYMIARCGSGHIGSSFSSLDIMSWMLVEHLKEDAVQDIEGSEGLFFSSKGHDAPGFYNVLLGLGKLDFSLLHRLRRLHGLPGHPDISTPNIITNTGSLGMGVSKAKGMIAANRLKGRAKNVYVLTGDGELQEGQFWESLISATNKSLHELTVIIDHNKLQSDTLVSKVSDLGDLAAKMEAFGWHVSRCDGNNLEEFSEVLRDSSEIMDRPKVIIADTVKGKGVTFMEHTSIDSDVELYKYHSGAPSSKAYIEAAQELIDCLNVSLANIFLEPVELEAVERPLTKAPQAPQKLVEAYSQSLLDHAAENLNIVALDADLALDTGLIPFQKKFPNRFIECGIAEQDMVSQAGGIALSGMLPIVHSFACFLTARPGEQIYNNATENTKIIYVGTLAGVVPGGPGHSHQGVRDIASMSSIPGITVMEPSCEEEVGMLLSWAINNNKKSSYIRLMSLPVATNFKLPNGYQPVIGKGVQLSPGTENILVAYGPQMLSTAMTVAANIQQEIGMEIGVVNLPWLNEVDALWLGDLLRPVSELFVIDNHYGIGGLGDRLARLVASEITIDVNMTCIGLEDIPACGTNEEILSRHRLDVQGIEKVVKRVINRS
jgi:transketolase